MGDAPLFPVCQIGPSLLRSRPLSPLPSTPWLSPHLHSCLSQLSICLQLHPTEWDGPSFQALSEKKKKSELDGKKSLGLPRGEMQITVSGPSGSPCNHPGLQVDGTLGHAPAGPTLALLPAPS